MCIYVHVCVYTVQYVHVLEYISYHVCVYMYMYVIILCSYSISVITTVIYSYHSFSYML